MVLRRHGQLTSGEGRASENTPLASPRPSSDPSAIRMQMPRKANAQSPVKGGEAVSLLRSEKAVSNVAVKSMKTGKIGAPILTPVSTPRRPGQDVDLKILQMAAHAASLRPPTSRSEVSAHDVGTIGLSAVRGTASAKGDFTKQNTPDESQKPKVAQPPLPPHAVPPLHAHRKPTVRDRKDEGV